MCALSLLGPNSLIFSFSSGVLPPPNAGRQVLPLFIIQLIFLQQYFPIPVPCNITRYCTGSYCTGSYCTGSYCTGPEAIYARYPSNQRAL